MTPTSFNGLEAGGNVLPQTPDTVPDGPVPVGLGHGPSNHDDESATEIDQYMQRLLDRVGQRTSSADEPLTTADRQPDSSPPRTPATVPPVPAAEAAAPVQPVAAGDADAPGADADAPGAEAATEPEPTPRARRSAPAESACDMPAMRALANRSAQDAINTYTCAEMTRLAYAKLMVAIVAAFVAVLLFRMASTDQSLSLAAAMLAVLIATVWGTHYLVLTCRAWFRSPRKSRAALQHSSPQEPTADDAETGG